MAHLSFIFICLVWGSSFILMKKAADVFGPLSISAGRVVGGALLLWAVWWLVGRGRRAFPLRRGDLGSLMVVAGCGYVLPFTLQPYLIGKHGESGFFGMMVALVPLLTIALSVPLLRTTPRPRQVAGVLLGLACLAVMMGVGHARHVPVGDLCLAALVPLGYATANVYIKRRFADTPPIALAAVALSMAALLLAPAAGASESVSEGPTSLPLAVLFVAILGLIGTGLTMWLFYHLIRSRGPLFAGMVTYLIPIGALAWGWADGETISRNQLLALGGVLVGVALVQTTPPPEVAPEVVEG